MYDNGSVSNNIKYRNICNPEYFVINIVYITKLDFFEIVNNTMVEWYDFFYLLEDLSMIVYDLEILKPFFQNNNLTINWRNATYLEFIRQVYN